MPNRTICDTLEAMRKCHETRNFSYLMGLIEEAQNHANRMEAALWDQRDLTYLREELSDLKKEKKQLEAKIKELKEQVGENNTNK